MKSDHVFIADNGSSTISLDRTNGQAASTSASAPPLTVTFNAATSSYTVTTSGRSQVFAPADKTGSDALGADYEKTGGGVTDYLTLLSALYSGETANRYVQMGFWQRNALTNTRQDTSFDAFTFGFETPGSAVPRTGRAGFTVDAFGLHTSPGFEPAIFDGRGAFDADFLTGVYSVSVPLFETGLLSRVQLNGGGINLTGGGHLSAGAGFNGNVVYGGSRVSVTGAMSGRFYGPGGEEIGAAFSGQDSSGNTFNGALTGQLNTSAPAVNQTLTNIVADQLFNTFEAHLYVVTPSSGVFGTDYASLISQFQLKANGQFFYRPGVSDMPGGTFTPAGIVASADPNFTAYRQTLEGRDVSLQLYKPGGGNTELPLTYLSFGIWNASVPTSFTARLASIYFTYGMLTKPGLLAAKTGSARYAGVVYGQGGNASNQALYNVRGSSSFDVDFSRQAVTGALLLNGTQTNGPGSIAFGQYDFSGAMGNNGNTLDLRRGTTTVGDVKVLFFGPDGEEVGGPFRMVVPAGQPGAGTMISGIAAAKR